MNNDIILKENEKSLESDIEECVQEIKESAIKAFFPIIGDMYYSIKSLYEKSRAYRFLNRLRLKIEKGKLLTDKDTAKLYNDAYINDHLYLLLNSVLRSKSRMGSELLAALFLEIIYTGVVDYETALLIVYIPEMLDDEITYFKSLYDKSLEREQSHYAEWLADNNRELALFARLIQLNLVVREKGGSMNTRRCTGLYTDLSPKLYKLILSCK